MSSLSSVGTHLNLQYGSLVPPSSIASRSEPSINTGRGKVSLWQSTCSVSFQPKILLLHVTLAVEVELSFDLSRTVFRALRSSQNCGTQIVTIVTMTWLREWRSNTIAIPCNVQMVIDYHNRPHRLSQEPPNLQQTSALAWSSSLSIAEFQLACLSLINYHWLLWKHI